MVMFSYLKYIINTPQKRNPNENKGHNDSQSNSNQLSKFPRPRPVQTPTFAEQIEEERQSVIQFHLLVIESQDEEKRGREVKVLEDKGHGYYEKTEGHVVVLEVAAVDQNQSWVQ